MKCPHCGTNKGKEGRKDDYYYYYYYIYLCNRDELSVQTALQNKVFGGADEHRLPSALCDGPDWTKQLRHLWRKHNHHVNHPFTF